ncbi:hypothetical protein [Ornithinimicrobium sufpigmenti]|uniref:hypothetical protein n=1 Tax=Ornithinimicrobium sufpigmenti TaxID=2508882 RepID=UPI001035FAF1|nr:MULTISPECIES: hypothetical protein [unclassified Ornithinimicrobium]
MRTRPAIVAALTASFTLFLGACSSGVDPQPGSAAGAPDTLDAGETTGTPGDPEPELAGSTAAPAARGFLCRYVDPETQAAVAGHDLSDPYQLIVANDEDSWVCEVRDGDAGVIQVSVLRGGDTWGPQRTLAQEQEGVTEGPEWFGEAYQSPRRVTGLTMCAGVVDGQRTHEPYALVVEAVTDSDEDVSPVLTTTAATLARSLDQVLGCSPKMARGEVPGPTPSS